MIWLRKDKVEVFQSLGKPKALHFVLMFWFRMTHIVDRRMAKLSPGCLINVLKHAPRGVLKSLISSNPVHDEQGLESFRSGPVVC
jgi:hypothetical protein